MFPVIKLFGKNFSSYSVVTLFGFLLGVGILFVLVRKNKKSFDDAIYVYVIGILGALLGAKILYILTVFPEFIKDLPLLFSDKDIFLYKYIFSGLVFYGGMIGCIIFTFIAYRFFHIKHSDYSFMLLPCYLLFAAAGRIGCMMVGCCYGKEIHNGIGITFHNSLYAPKDVKLFPTQPLEALFDIMLFIFFMIYGNRQRDSKRLVKIYLLLYAAFRFILELFRGDAERGFFGALSVSQWISIVILAALSFDWLKGRVHKIVELSVKK